MDRRGRHFSRESPITNVLALKIGYIVLFCNSQFALLPSIYLVLPDEANLERSVFRSILTSLIERALYSSKVGVDFLNVN